MKKERVWPTSFKAKPVAKERIDYGRSALGLSLDHLQNGIWEAFGRQYLEQEKQGRAPQIKKLLEDPVP